MKTIAYRIDETLEAIIGELFAFYGINGDNFSDKVRDFFIECHKRTVIQNLSPEAQVTDLDLECVNRIFHQSSHWCVTRPPKMVKLATLEICKVCKKRKIGLPARPSQQTEKIIEPAKTPEPEPQKKPIYPKGTVYCFDDGIEVWTGKCETCKTPCDQAPDKNPYLSDYQKIKRQRLAEAQKPKTD